MILIADSGSTKTNWALLDGEKLILEKHTEGINPFFRNSNDIFAELSEHLVPEIPAGLKNLHFYGAGITNSEKGTKVRSILEGLFPGVFIETFSDLLAAARATCGNNAGIACILGTGSNSCLFDGEKIVEQISPLGFVLGDEGSGAVMGRKLLGDYLKNVMPENLRILFAEEYPLTRDEILEKVYRHERPNLFLSGFTRFLYQNIGSTYCRRFVQNEFELFVGRNLLNYPGYKNYTVNFVGSVGYYFQDILKGVLKRYSLECGLILQDPMEGLIRFYTEK